MEKITFSIAAADVNLLDTSPYTLWTFSTSTVIIIPKLLKLQRDAGTAYTVTRGAFIDQAKAQAPEYIDSITDQYQGGGAYLEFFGVERESNAATKGEFYGPLWFRVPIEGFLDQALDNWRVALPADHKVFGNGVTKIKVRSTVPLASGTGALKGSIIFEQHKVNFA